MHRIATALFRINFVTILVLSLPHNGWSYKPVMLLHGVLAGADSMHVLQQQIELHHPGTKIYNCDQFPNWNSLESAWRQVKKMGDMLMEIAKDHPKGIHFIGHSQGGLLGRAVLQSYPEHNIKTFISLSSPQAGQYGTEFLHLIFPDLVARTAFELFYSRVGQHISVANYWNDPHKQDLYYKYSNFLPFINNEIESTNSTTFKASLLKLQKLVLIGGPDDGVITPWQSSQFGYFNASLDVIPFEERSIFKTDAIGLKTMTADGRLVVLSVPHVNHLQWHRKHSVIRKYILPFLD